MARAGASLNVRQRLHSRRSLRSREIESDRRRVDHVQGRPFAHAVRRHPSGDVFVLHVVFPPESHVFRVERIAVRPARAFDEVQGELRVVVVPLPAFREIRERSGLVFRLDLPKRADADEALLHRHVDAAPSLMLAGHPVPSFGPPSDHMAEYASVLPDAVRHRAGQVHQRFFRKPVFNRRKLARRHQFAQERRFRVTVQSPEGP